MKLNHLNLTVSNVPETHRFLEKHFGFKGYGAQEPREAMSFLADDNGMVLALFRAASPSKCCTSLGAAALATYMRAGYFRCLDIPAPSATIGEKVATERKGPMNIEIRDATLQARIQKQLQATGSCSVEEVLARLLETQEEQDRWLQENREAINEKIGRGIAQLDRGEGIPEDRADAYLKELKAKPE